MEKLLDRGLHPVRIAVGFDRACKTAVKTLEEISDEVRVSEGRHDVSMMSARAGFCWGVGMACGAW